MKKSIAKVTHSLHEFIYYLSSIQISTLLTGILILFQA